MCFGCDGTLLTTDHFGPGASISQRPVPLHRLMALTEAGALIVICPLTAACEELPYPRIIAGPGNTVPDRVDALRETARRYSADLRLNVSDNHGDDQIPRQAGFCYIHPYHFR